MPSLEITCPHCERTTTLDAEKVPDRPVSYKCPGCQGRIVVDKSALRGGASKSEASEAVSPGPTARQEPERLEMPPGTTLPPGLLVVEADTPAAPIRERLEAYECHLELMETAEEARRRALIDPPGLLLYAARSIEKPPYAPIEPLTRLPPRERREIFLCLIAGNVKTLDGNLAFLLGVDVLVNQRDMERLPPVLHDALRHHHRIYRPFLDALEAM